MARRRSSTRSRVTPVGEGGTTRRKAKANWKVTLTHRAQVRERQGGIDRCSGCFAYGVPLTAGRCARCP